MIKVKSISILILSSIIFISCNDVTSSDKKRDQIVINPNPINTNVGEGFTYEGEVTNGPAADLFVSFKKGFSENVEIYNDWLTVRLIDNGNKYIIEGNPDEAGDYHFRVTVQRENDFNLDVGSYVTGLSVKVDE
jgi:hypothetical protein